VHSGLTALFWAEPAAGGGEPRLTLFARIMWLLVALYVPVGAFGAYTFVAGWDADVGATLANLPQSLLWGFLYPKLLEIARPRTGRLAAMFDGRSLPQVALANLHCVRVIFVSTSIIPILALGLIPAAEILATGKDPTAPNAAALSDDPAEWGGYAGSTFARLYWATIYVLGMPLFPFVFLPFCYSLVAAAELAHHVVDAVIADVEEADSHPEPLSVAATQRIGCLVQSLQEDMLQQLTDGWAAGLSACVCVILFVVALLVPGVARGDPMSIYSCFGCGMCILALLHPLARATSRAQALLGALNNCRTVGTRTNKGLVAPECDARITTVIAYLKDLNAGAGPGAVVFEQVISTKLLKMLLLTLFKYGSIGIPLLLEYQRQMLRDESGSGSA
jgi:hypothetical protein